MRFIPAVSLVRIRLPLPAFIDKGSSSPNRGSRSGPVVKGLRHRPFTAATRVRISSGSPIEGRIAQLVRALASHARGQRFESVCAHQKSTYRVDRCFLLFVHFSLQSKTAVSPAVFYFCVPIRLAIHISGLPIPLASGITPTILYPIF